MTFTRRREEELFYQAMKRKTDQDGKDLLAEAIEEHHVVTTLMDELKGLDPKDERYDAKFKVLSARVRVPREGVEDRGAGRQRRAAARRWPRSTSRQRSWRCS